jgi:hypothetical protein
LVASKGGGNRGQEAGDGKTVFRFFGNAVGRWQKGKEIAAKRRKMESVELGAGGIEPEE